MPTNDSRTSGRSPSPAQRPLPIVLALLAVAVGMSASTAQELEVVDPRDELVAAVDELPARYRDWVRSVAGLLSVEELRFFVELKRDYQRDAFMEAFWEPRDPDPTTPRNELRDRWERVRSTAGTFPFGDPRFRLFLLNGPAGGWTLPDGRPVGRCYSRFQELEIWFYGGSLLVPRRFLVIFQKPGTGAPYEVYRPGGNLRPINRSGGLPSQDIQDLCADELLRYATREAFRTPGYEQLLERAFTPPLPSAEWLASFRASGTEIPEGAETFEVAAEVDHPTGRRTRTAVRMLLRIPREAAPGRDFGGEIHHDFLLTGEVIRGDSLFESFRYRFEGPTPAGTDVIPLGFTRYLRPGEVTLRLLVEDVHSGRFAQVVRAVDVPSPEGRPPDESERAALPDGPTLELYAPPGDVLTGLVRFTARATGELDRVRFLLDGEQVFSKRTPPYSVELDLGETPEPHRIRVVGTRNGEEVAGDQIWLNQGAKRFRLEIVEPREGGIYPGSATVRVAVQTPDGGAPESLDLWVDDRFEGRLEAPSFSRAVRLTHSGPAVLRAVARLADGTEAEDVVLINAAGATETVEVRLVELSVLVTGEDGRPLVDLGREDFRILEDGVGQPIARFAPPGEAPNRVALLVDRSTSMKPHLPTVVEAATAFADGILRDEEDRVAVLSFADGTTVDVPFTADRTRIDRALAGLVAFGPTGLYDAVVQALGAFEGQGGLQALVLFSDGRDEGSRLTLEQTLAAARRAGAVVVALGLEAAFPDRLARRPLEELAEGTGGRAVFLGDLAELPAVFRDLRGELASRYFIAYQAPEGGGGAYRTIEVEVDVPGARVRTRDGYLP